MTYNAESINLNEFDINDLADISANLQISPNRGAEFIEQSLPLILQKLSHTEQDLKQKTQLMLADVLPNYERLQRLTQIGALLNDELNQQTVSIKRQYPALFKEVKHVIKYARQLLLLLQQLEQMHPSYITQAKSMTQSFSQQCSLLYDQLVKRAILVVKQPDEIIKKGNQFDTQIVLLIDIPSPTPSVRIRIISAADAELLKTGAAQCTQISPAATTVNNQGTLNFNNGNLHSHFSKKPTLKEISSRVNTAGGRRLAVTEQKYVVLYEIVLSSAVASGGTETIWALSLPIVLIVHASQLSDAYATIIWDRMFHNENEADWGQFSWLLNVIFKHITGATSRALSDSDMLYFRNKLDVKANGKLTFQQFAKNKTTADFTFWTWFESIAQLIKVKLLPYWEKGYIIGFSSKEELSEIMSRTNQAAFLLRFSDSKLGTVSLSTFRHDSSGLMYHAPYLLPLENIGSAGSIVSLLRDFDQIQHIRYICNVHSGLTDKTVVFSDPELNVVPNSGNATADGTTGYHKLTLVIKGTSTESADDQRLCDSISSSMSEASCYDNCPYASAPASNLGAVDYTDAAQSTSSRGTPNIDASLGESLHAYGSTQNQWAPSSADYLPHHVNYELNANLPSTIATAMANIDANEGLMYPHNNL